MAKNLAKDVSLLKYVYTHTPGEAYPLMGLVTGICVIATYNLFATAHKSSDVVVNKTNSRPFMDNSMKSEASQTFEWKKNNQKKVWSM